MTKLIFAGFHTISLTIFLTVAAGSNFTSQVEAKPLTCKSVYLYKYLNQPLHKAMATSGGRPPSASMAMQCGWAFGYKTKRQAERTALQDCRGADRNYKNRRDCKILYSQ